MAKATSKAAEPTPTAPPKRLTKLSHVRKEIARVYIDARAGSIATGEASRLVYVLKCLGEVLVAESFEVRLEKLEGQRNGTAKIG